MQKTLYTWQHAIHGHLLNTNDIDKLLSWIKKGPYPQPDKAKLKKDLEATGRFEYAGATLIITATV